MLTATTDPVRMPPGSRLPKPIQGIAYLISNHDLYAASNRRYGSLVIGVKLPGVGKAVVISDPAVAKELFGASTDVVERPTFGGGSLGDAFGPGSTFSLGGKKLLARRKIVVPHFHGNRMRSYEPIIEDEVMREIATWPEGRKFETLHSMTSITLGAILRAVFGAEGAALDELRDLLPPMVTMACLVLTLPQPLRRNFGPWSPWSRHIQGRRRFDSIVSSMIAEARVDPNLQDRSDALALLVRSNYEDNEPLPDDHIADELFTLVASGHETTAGSMAWAIERICRHPDLLSRLTAEVDSGGSELRQATIWEVQRTRPVLDSFVRRTKTRIRLGDWVIPENTNLIVSIRLAHESVGDFDSATSFDPNRFLGTVPKPAQWIPFGGGINRCVGAAFANMEMDITIRTLLRELRFVATDAPNEKGRWRGVATVPAKGALATVYRRSASAVGEARSASIPEHG